MLDGKKWQFTRERGLNKTLARSTAGVNQQHRQNGAVEMNEQGSTWKGDEERQVD